MNIAEEAKMIAEHYGYDEQSGQLIEECAELVQAISKYRRAKKSGVQPTLSLVYENLVEEIADVELMIEQVKYLLQIPEEDIQANKVYKISRTRVRIAQESMEGE
jgi:NTP pyrophosphatase (non-canonical NTP hydrolase)